MPQLAHNIDRDLNSRLLSLTQDGTYTLTQINGQRVYRKNFWSGPEPQRECEIFIGRIPHDCFEDELIPLFQSTGELFEFRLMINFSGWNRGYAFAMYMREADAINAIILFNNYVIRPSWELGVCQSINNCRIFISRIPPTTSADNIIRIMYTLTDEVKLVSIRRAAASCSAIVEYKSHRGAAIARKALVAASVYAWGLGVRPAVVWSMHHSEQLLHQYREMGCMTPEGEVRLWYKEEVAPSAAAAPTEEVAPPVIAAPSYALEPRQQARRMRLIYEAHRTNSADSSRPVSPSAGPYSADLSRGGLYSAGNYSVGLSRYDGRLAGLFAHMPPLSQPNPQRTNGYSNIASNECNGASVYSVVNNGQAMAENAVWLPPTSPLPTASATPLATSLESLTFNPWTAPNPLFDSMNQKNGSSSE